MSWKKTTFILCMFGFLKEFRPSEPFITNYLIGPWKNFTPVHLNQDIFPYGTYFSLAFLILVFLITDFLRYKTVIIICGLSGTITFLILLLGKTVFEMQIVEAFYGLFISTEVAYYTYIYAVVEKTHYQKVTGLTRAAYLLGRFMAGSCAQLTTSFGVLDYEQLLYLTITALALSTVWAFLLPSVSQSIYFHRDDKTEVLTLSNNLQPSSESGISNLQNDHSRKPTPLLLKLKRAYSFLWKDFLKAYTNSHVVKWSIWWASATCGYIQIISYIQLIWETAFHNESDKIYNGAVEALYTIISAIAVFGVGTLRVNWPLIGEVTLSVLSFIEGILIFVCSESYNIWLLYAVYILFGVIYNTVITVASFEVAKNLSEDSYGLIFGINTFLALVLQSVLTLIVASGSILSLNIRQQYLVYSGYFAVLAMVFMIMGLLTIIKYCRQGKKFQIWLDKELKIDNTLVSR